MRQVDAIQRSLQIHFFSHGYFEFNIIRTYESNTYELYLKRVNNEQVFMHLVL